MLTALIKNSNSLNKSTRGHLLLRQIGSSAIHSRNLPAGLLKTDELVQCDEHANRSGSRGRNEQSQAATDIPDHRCIGFVTTTLFFLELPSCDLSETPTDGDESENI